MIRFRTHPDATKAHLADRGLVGGDVVSLCGAIDTTNYPAALLVREDERSVVCANCRRVAGSMGLDVVDATVNEAAAVRGSAIPAENIRPVPASVFRVRGSSDVYTVVIPHDKDVATSCTCMASKTNPQRMCKHTAACVFHLVGGVEEAMRLADEKKSEQRSA